MKRLIVSTSWVILVTAFLLEATLRLIDPFGAYAYRSAWETLRTRPDTFGYTFVPDTYHLRGWSATINADGYRAMNSATSDCDIAVIGDSATFGWGVNDSDTWVQLLADSTPLVHFDNYGLPAYNIGNISALYASLRDSSMYDGYIYLIVPNDAQKDATYTRPSAEPMTAIEYYLASYNVEQSRGKVPEDIARFRTLFNAMKADNMLSMRLENNSVFYNAIADIAPLSVGYTHKVSKADPHANAEGNAELYAQIEPLALPFIDKVCNN